MSYENIKKYITERKGQVTTLVVCAVMFIVGFGTGKAFDQPTQPDYSANSGEKPGAKSKATGKAADESAEAGDTASPATEKKSDHGVPDSSNPVAGQPCVIKGNISGSSKIYHLKGGASYEKTTPEACFNTEAEAVAAGFRKAKR
jgi:hypothetical protein